MHYYLDFEFLEGAVPQQIKGINIPKWLSKPNNTIQPISIGLVSEDSREYYAIFKNFNLKEAWNKFDLERQNHPFPIKRYWIRENVLKPIWIELSLKKDPKYSKIDIENLWDTLSNRGRYIRMKLLLTLYGKTSKQIAKEIKDFIIEPYQLTFEGLNLDIIENPIKVFGYYSSYDWTAFCQLYGIMINLPKGFPYYCRDLKQLADQIREETGIDTIFPKGDNVHNALSDAKWNKQFHEFLMTITSK